MQILKQMVLAASLLGLFAAAVASASEGFPDCTLSLSLAPKQDGSVDTITPSSLNQKWKYVSNYDSDMLEAPDFFVQAERPSSEGSMMLAITNKKTNTSMTTFMDLSGRTHSGSAMLEVRDGSLSYDGKALFSINVECKSK